MPIANKKAASSFTLYHVSVTVNEEDMKEPKAKQPSEAEVEASNAHALHIVDMEGKKCSSDNGEETKGIDSKVKKSESGYEQ